jgi:enoyl-CoA hydratase
MCGVEYFAHPWEFGPRRAKELLLTGDSLDVDEAHAIGMVSKVFPRAELEQRTLALARRIAGLPTVTALLIKESVNQSVDNMGFYNALNACFTLHELNHSHWAEIHEDKAPIGKADDGIVPWKAAPPVTERSRSKALPARTSRRRSLHRSESAAVSARACLSCLAQEPYPGPNRALC